MKFLPNLIAENLSLDMTNISLLKYWCYDFGHRKWHVYMPRNAKVLLNEIIHLHLPDEFLRDIPCRQLNEYFYSDIYHSFKIVILSLFNLLLYKAKIVFGKLSCTSEYLETASVLEKTRNE